MKRLKLFLLLIVTMMLAAGCGQEKIPEDGNVVYYLNKEGTSLVPAGFEITGDSPEIRV